MALRIKVDVSQLIHRTSQVSKRYRSASITLGYNSPVAVFLHENMEMKWKGLPRPSDQGAYWDALNGQGSSKFLETPLRQMGGAGILAGKLAQGLRGPDGSVETGLKLAARALLDESLKRVPYETGGLYRSAFIDDPVVAGVSVKVRSNQFETFVADVGQ
jgi:hypothetical protein